MNSSVHLNKHSKVIEILITRYSIANNNFFQPYMQVSCTCNRKIGSRDRQNKIRTHFLLNHQLLRRLCGQESRESHPCRRRPLYLHSSRARGSVWPNYSVELPSADAGRSVRVHCCWRVRVLARPVLFF